MLDGAEANGGAGLGILEGNEGLLVVCRAVHRDEILLGSDLVLAAEDALRPGQGLDLGYAADTTGGGIVRERTTHGRRSGRRRGDGDGFGGGRSSRSGRGSSGTLGSPPHIVEVRRSGGFGRDGASDGSGASPPDVVEEGSSSFCNRVRHC